MLEKTLYHLYSCETVHEKWKGYLSGFIVSSGILVSIVYNRFYHLHCIHLVQLAFALLGGNYLKIRIINT